MPSGTIQAFPTVCLETASGPAPSLHLLGGGSQVAVGLRPKRAVGPAIAVGVDAGPWLRVRLRPGRIGGPELEGDEHAGPAGLLDRQGNALLGERGQHLVGAEPPPADAERDLDEDDARAVGAPDDPGAA